MRITSVNPYTAFERLLSGLVLAKTPEAPAPRLSIERSGSRCIFIFHGGSVCCMFDRRVLSMLTGPGRMSVKRLSMARCIIMVSFS